MTDDAHIPGASAPQSAGPGPLRRLLRAARRHPILSAATILALAAVAYVGHLEVVIVSRFSGRLWPIPARVYGRPLELYEGGKLEPVRLFGELALLGYEEADTSGAPGTFVRTHGGATLTTRGFRFGDGDEPSRTIDVELRRDRVAHVRNEAGENVPLVRLSPPRIGSILPASNEDRIALTRDDVPPLLIEALLAVEDRRFHRHHGLDPIGIARAVVANVRAGRLVQGGSTLTQQLVRSAFLHNRRSFRRKFDEAIMALALERRHDKWTILEAYLNEVYMGQDGRRAIHGFGLASYFYLDKPIDALAAHEIALLVGMVKGPTAYDPRRRPAAARARRDVVLDVLVERAVFSREAADAAREQTLVRESTASSASAYHPAFLDVVRRDLASDYDEEALSSEGLRIFTTLDPFVQGEAERALASGLSALEARYADLDSLEGAVVVTSVEGGEVLAVAGGRAARYDGFNRAIAAERAVGSILKPALYLHALERGDYTLSSTLEDTLLEVRMPNGTTWAPKNFDGQFAGTVPLCLALMRSRNVPTVRLGLELGVEPVVATMSRLGIEGEIRPFPSAFLGAVPLSPLDVARLYNTLATGGFVTPLRAVREVLDAGGEPLQRYPLELRQACESEVAFQITRALNATTHLGTARSLRAILPVELEVAGKTGTTDDHRDSWFAGFSGDRVAVVWVGRDDNAPTGLTGATGALPIWGDLMAAIADRSIGTDAPPGIEEHWIDVETGKRSRRGCEGAVWLPYPKGRAPHEEVACGERNIAERAVGWIRDIFR